MSDRQITTLGVLLGALAVAAPCARWVWREFFTLESRISADTGLWLEQNRDG